jgi:hypothetical protein
MGTSTAQAFSAIQPLIPRIAMSGAMLIAFLDKFEAAGFDADKELLLSPDEMRALAKQASYPLEEVVANATKRA